MNDQASKDHLNQVMFNALRAEIAKDEKLASEISKVTAASYESNIDKIKLAQYERAEKKQLDVSIRVKYIVITRLSNH